MVTRFPVIRRPQRRRDQRGVVAVEFALVMPILLLLVFGIIEFGYMLNRDTIVNNTSRDGARVGSLAGKYADICIAVKDELKQMNIPVPNAATPTNGNCATQVGVPTTIVIDCKTPAPASAACGATNATTYDTKAASGGTTIVKVTYKHSLITPVISAVLGDVVTLQQNTQMRIE